MELYEHQIAVLNQTQGQDKVAYYLDMGLGKTFVGAEKMIRLGTRVNLLICQKSKIADWVNHFNEYYTRNCVLDLTKPIHFESFFNWIKNEVPTLIIGIINYELAWRRPELLKLKDFTLMLDESSLIQNQTAKQTKFILKLQAKNVILLSGTPTSGKYENLWTQCHLLGWNISKTLYDKHYINWKLLDIGGRKIKTVNKANPYKNVERLKAKMREHGAVFMKTEECFNLPEQNFIEVNVSAAKEYNLFMRNSIVTVNDVELVGDTTLTKRLYARQLCGQYSEAKLQAFRDLIESTNDRIIVFYNFNDELEKLNKICEELNKPVSQINGHVKDLTAYEKESNSVTLCQYQAASMGHNLQKANKIIYFTLPERSELFEQSKKRIHRIGQNKACFYYIMICNNSVERLIYKTLKERKDFTDELFKENINFLF